MQATVEQIDLLSRVQTLGIAQEVNPLDLDTDQATELFRCLPDLASYRLTGRTMDRKTVEQEILCVNERALGFQRDRWLEKNNLTLEHTSQPEFTGGQRWLDFFKQDPSGLNLRTVEQHFKTWNIKLISGRLKTAFQMDEQGLMDFHNRQALKTQRAVLRAYVEAGVMEPLPKEQYMALTQSDAAKLIAQYKAKAEKSPEYIRREREHDDLSSYLEMLPGGKLVGMSNDKIQEFIWQYKTGHLSDENYQLIREQAALKKQSAAHAARDADKDFFPELNQDGVLHDEPASWEQKAILRDLAERGELFPMRKVPSFIAKLKYLTDTQAQKLIAPNEGLDATPSQRAAVRGLIEDRHLGELPDGKWETLTINEARHMIEGAREVERLRTPATEKQKEMLSRLIENKQLATPLETLDKLSLHQASQLIAEGMETRNAQPATIRQRDALRSLVYGKKIEPIPIAEWKTLTYAQACAILRKNEQRAPVTPASALPRASSARPRSQGLER